MHGKRQNRELARLTRLCMAVAFLGLVAMGGSSARAQATCNTTSTTPSKDELQNIRIQIDAIDCQMLNLLNARANLALRAAQVKRQRNLPLYAPAREAQVVAQLAAMNTGPLSAEAITRIWQHVFMEMTHLEAQTCTCANGD